MNKRPLVPSFLQKLDDRLLKNKPATWAARTHLVLWFALLFSLVLGGCCYLAFYNATEYNNIESWMGFVSVIATISFIFWMIFLLRFNVFKRYGNWLLWDGLKDFVLYFICIGAMVAVCFIPSAVATFRANQQFTNDEIVADVNEINTTACKLEYGLLPLEWTMIEKKIVDSIPRIIEVQEYVNDTAVKYNEYAVTTGNGYIDTAELRMKLAATDSVVKVNDSLYQFYECPDYLFVSPYNATDYTTTNALRSEDIYRNTIRNFKKPDRAALLEKMKMFEKKYAAESRYGYSYDTNTDYENLSYNAKIIQKYKLEEINDGISNATRKMHEWKRSWPIYLRVFYYTTFFLTLLVFMFRHTTTKTFFVTLLTGALIAIFSGLLIAVSRGDEMTFLVFQLVYFVIFAIIALTIFNAKTRKLSQGIGLNLFYLMTPFLPLIIWATYIASIENYYYGRGMYDNIPDGYVNPVYYIHYFEIGGSILFLILLEPLFRKLYRKWYAAAEN